MFIAQWRYNDVLLAEKQRLRGRLDQLRLTAQLTLVDSSWNKARLPPTLAHTAITRQCCRNEILTVKATGRVSIIRQVFAAYAVSLS